MLAKHVIPPLPQSPYKLDLNPSPCDFAMYIKLLLLALHHFGYGLQRVYRTLLPI
jgi:hypothetical protein